ncbi:MAG TPA: hypothetical protein VFN67_42545 [Polyangiales bacterium]|nr:hypothetical protein [Polyangiales bacterium]
MATPRKPNRPPTRDRILISLRSGCSLRAVEGYYDGAKQRESTRIAIARALKELGMVIPECQRAPKLERDPQFHIISQAATAGSRT